MELSRFKPLDFPGAGLDWGRDYYILHLDGALQFLSSAPLGEGFVDARWVVSYKVDINFNQPDPEAYLREQASRLGVPGGESFIGLLTAVSHRELRICTRSESGVTVTTLATVGTGNSSSPHQKDIGSFGDSQGAADVPVYEPGTINIVTLIDADLTPGAMVRASTIATEAKTLALVEAGVKTREGYIATGTSTDVTVVGQTGRGRHFDYAGSPTLVGWLVGHTVYHAVAQGMK